MKTSTIKNSNLLVLVLLFLISAITLNAQVAVNSSGTPPNASAMLDVSSVNQGVLIPRVAWGSVTTPVQGLLVYFNAGAPSGNGFYYYDSGWKRLSDGSGILAVTAGGTGTGTQFIPGSVVFAGAGGVYTEDNANFFWDDANNRLGIGPATPATELTVSRNTYSASPAILVAQIGAGDPAIRYYSNVGGVFNHISTGIDNSDNDNFKISNSTSLTGNTYTDANTMQRIHNEQGSVGITDINHQSRARAYLSQFQSIPPFAWTNINFDVQWFDEHIEFTVSNPFGNPAYFTALEDGYYQVNARTEYDVLDLSQAVADGYVNIAIFVNGMIHSEGNKLQMVIFGGDLMPNNNAPNVSDVVYLVAGQTVEIMAWQSVDGLGLVLLIPNSEKTYVSIHKIS